MMRRVFVFFFKQKTAYEMRISDWSSDVCSSDLREALDSHGLVDACKARPPYRQNDCPGAAGSQFVALRRKIQVFPHAVVAIAGGKLEAANSRDRNFTGRKVKVRRKQLDESVARYLAELDRADRAVTAKPASMTGFRRATYCFRSEEHTSELQSLMRLSYAVFC